MKVALAQVRSSEDPWENLFSLNAMVEEATAAKAALICFPENVFFRGRKRFLTSEFGLNLNDDKSLKITSDFSQTLSDFINQWQISVSLGSVPQLPYNSHWMVQDERIHSYHKIHLFNYSGQFGTYRESDEMTAGSSTEVVKVAGKNVGLSICYDLRFPELYRRLTLNQKAEVLLVPAAFTFETGKAHWHSLLRARAIENLSFVVAAGQWGSHLNQDGKELFCYGHSLIISPWGEIIAEAPESSDALLIADLDFDYLKEKRERLPALDSAVLFS